jgi:hypothetical protein
MKLRFGVAAALALFVPTALVVACDSDDGGDEGMTVDAPPFADVHQVFIDNCLCHFENSAGEKEADYMTLNIEVAHQELLAPSEQASLARVQPGSLEESYLWHKLKGTHLDVGGEGEQMPLIGEIDAAELELFETWILGGAPST